MNIGYNSSQYRNEESFQVESLDVVCKHLPVISLNKLNDDLTKVIFDYCDRSVFPMYEDVSRDFWLLERVKRFRIKYFDEI